MSREILIGIDIGTSRIKAVATDLELSYITDFALPTPWRHEKNLTDIDMAKLAEVVISVASKAAESAGGVVRALGITGFSETGVLLDSTCKPLAPGLAWHDPRGEVGPINDVLGEYEFRARAGAPVNEINSVAKTLWLNKNFPESWGARYFLSAPEWVAYLLGGELVNESSLISRSGFFDVSTSTPWKAAIELVGGGDDFLARIVGAGDPVGIVGPNAPTNLQGAIITIAGHDHFTAAYYCGAVNEGSLFDSMGTAEALLRTFKKRLPEAEIASLAAANVGLSISVIPDHYTLLGALPTGLTLERVCALLGIESRDEKIAIGFKALEADVSSSSVKVINDYHGLSITNLDDAVSPALLWRAAIEHLGKDSATMIDLIEKSTGKATDVVIAGGWIKNPMMAAQKKAQFGKYKVSEALEAGAMGAAEFAGVAAQLIKPRWL